MATTEQKSALASLVIKNAPFDDTDNLLAFIDYLRIFVLHEQGAQNILDNGGLKLLETIMFKYFIEKDFPEDANPKAVRIITWRFIANATKYGAGRELIASAYEMLMVAVNTIISELISNKALVKSTVLALNNIVFAEGGLDVDVKALEELFANLTTLLDMSESNILIATLNILCKIASNYSEIAKRSKSNSVGLEAQLCTLALSKVKGVAMFAEDLTNILSASN